MNQIISIGDTIVELVTSTDQINFQVGFAENTIT